VNGSGFIRPSDMYLVAPGYVGLNNTPCHKNHTLSVK